MSETFKVKVEKQYGKNISSLLQEWLKMRESLLIAYYRLNRIAPFDDQQHRSDGLLLKHFCTLLTQYVSQGHTKFFKACTVQPQMNQHAYELQQERLNMILSALETHTKCVRLFTQQQKYPARHILPALRSELSKLGEQLTDRIDLEDKLITNFL